MKLHTQCDILLLCLYQELKFFVDFLVIRLFGSIYICIMSAETVTASYSHQMVPTLWCLTVVRNTIMG